MKLHPCSVFIRKGRLHCTLPLHSRQVTYSETTLVLSFLLSDNLRSEYQLCWSQCKQHFEHLSQKSTLCCCACVWVRLLLAVTGSAHGYSALTDKIASRLREVKRICSFTQNECKWLKTSSFFRHTQLTTRKTHKCQFFRYFLCSSKFCKLNPNPHHPLSPALQMNMQKGLDNFLVCFNMSLVYCLWVYLC